MRKNRRRPRTDIAKLGDRVWRTMTAPRPHYRMENRRAARPQPAMLEEIFLLRYAISEQVLDNLELRTRTKEAR